MITHRGALLMRRSLKIQCGSTLSKALDRSASSEHVALSLSNRFWIPVTALCGFLNIDRTVCDGCILGAVALITCAAAVPSTGRSSVFGIPRGLKLSASGPIFALGIQTTCSGGNAVSSRIS